MKWLMAILVVLFLGSNAFWLYHWVDAGITLSYRDQQIYQLEETRKQLMLLLPEIATGTSKEEIVTAAGKFADQGPFEKDGCTWVGWLGFKFSEEGRLQSVSPSWSLGKPDPCYPPS